ncbi:MAG TPA: rhomboid family intramembrane serine protease [Sphingomicrobium sp.]|nr:rhomboid family intramembrane serine protease [Sphingomicrobium sp.]
MVDWSQARATLAIAALTAAAWLVVTLPGLGEQAVFALGFIPARLSGAEAPWAAAPALLTPLTATLVHSGILHLVFNLLVFLWCGAAVERALGRFGLLLLYAVGAYAAAIGQWLTDPMGIVPMVGASGAVSAVIGAFSLTFGRARMITRSARVNRWINIAWLLAAWVALQMMIGWAAGTGGLMLATAAHVGGFLAGLLMQRPLLLWRFRNA